MRVLVAPLAAALLLSVGCQMDREPIADIAAAAPDNVTVLLVNPYVRVSEFRLAPGEGLPLHAGGPRLVYSLSEYKLLWTEGGEETEQKWSTGQVHWHEALPHEVRNVGTTEARYLVVTRLGEPLPVDSAEVVEDVADAAPRQGKLLFNNETMRLLQVTLQAGEEIPMHNGRPRAIYALTDYTMKYQEEGEEPETADFRPGSVHFHGSGMHAVVNVGGTTARFLVFGLKL